mmetsp:Transcript_99927/g.172349  ORF Transcript_99927/g.172349 Transcript_99927/m.172349 type:complete len:284 (-) Transcript_99927:587-1438(-)
MSRRQAPAATSRGPVSGARMWGSPPGGSPAHGWQTASAIAVTAATSRWGLVVPSAQTRVPRWRRRRPRHRPRDWSVSAGPKGPAMRQSQQGKQRRRTDGRCCSVCQGRSRSMMSACTQHPDPWRLKGRRSRRRPPRAGPKPRGSTRGACCPSSTRCPLRTCGRSSPPSRPSTAPPPPRWPRSWCSAPSKARLSLRLRRWRVLPATCISCRVAHTHLADGIMMRMKTTMGAPMMTLATMVSRSSTPSIRTPNTAPSTGNGTRTWKAWMMMRMVSGFTGDATRSP